MDNTAAANDVTGRGCPGNARATSHEVNSNAAASCCGNRQISTRNRQRTEEVTGNQAARYGTLSLVDRAQVVDVRVACEILCVGRTTLYELVAAGEINSFTVGRRRLFTRTGLSHFVEKRGGLVDRPGPPKPPDPPDPSSLEVA